MEEEILGCIGDGAKDTDFILQEGDIDKLPELFEKDDIIFEYNQCSSLDCTIYGAIGAVSDQTNYEYPKERIQKLVDKSYTMGRLKGHGWYVESACKLVKDDWNNDAELVKKYGKIAYYRVRKVNRDIIEKILKKKYTLVGNRSCASAFTKDYKTDGVLNGTDFGTETNGHCICIISMKGVRSEKNSYKGTSKTYDGKDCNIFELKHFMDEISNYGPNLYVFTLVREDNYEEIKRLNEFKAKVNLTIENNSAMYHLTNSVEFQNKLHDMNEFLRGKLKDIDIELEKCR